MNTNIPSPFQDKPATMAFPMRTNWNGAILIGVIWLVLGLGGGSIWAHIGTRRQAESYRIALTALSSMPEAAGLERFPEQRRATLLKKNSIYDWRAIVWIRADQMRAPYIWRAHVVHEGDTFRCTSVRLEPYNVELAYSLSLYTDPYSRN